MIVPSVAGALSKVASACLVCLFLAGCDGKTTFVAPEFSGTSYRLSVEQPTRLVYREACHDDPNRVCTVEHVRSDWSLTGTVVLGELVEANGRFQPMARAQVTADCMLEESIYQASEFRLLSNGHEQPLFPGEEPLQVVMGMLELHGRELPDGTVQGTLYWVHLIGRNLTWEEAAFRMEPS